jgi:hypothetical protein
MPKGCTIKTRSQAKAAFASGWEGPKTSKDKKKISNLMKKGRKKKRK